MAEVPALADCRELTYDEYGDPDGVPVIFNHGIGFSRLHRNPDDGLTAALGFDGNPWCHWRCLGSVHR